MIGVQVSEVPQWKIEKVDAISKLALKHPVIALGSLSKIRGSQIQSLRRSLRGKVTFLVAKNNLVARALSQVEEKKPKIKELAEKIEGSNVILFTEMNPFKLVALLDKSKTKLTAKVGDIAPADVVVSAGNTGLPPGPVITDFTEAGIRTRIEAGSVWVISDTVVAKKGEPISLRLASILSKLGIKPIESGLALYVAYDHGLVIPGESLRIDVEDTERDLLKAETNALNLALSVWYPTAQSITGMLARGSAQVRSLGINSFFLDRGFIQDLLRQTRQEASALESRLPTRNPQ